MATGTRYYTPNPFEFDANGAPLANAQLFFYETGTSVLLNTFSDVNLTTPNANPVRADANGRFGTVFLEPSTAYKVQLWTAPTDGNPTGTMIWSEDPCGPAAGGVPTNTQGIIGEVRAFAGPDSALPSLWYLCYGQPVSRTTFASLFAVIGTTWGIGDGTTTFNLPDLRGRGVFGKDDMGGSAANRVTNAVSGITGTTLGVTGGNQALTSHTHAVTDPTHTHTVTDPGHTHPETLGQGAAGAAAAWSVTNTGTQQNAAGLTTGSATTGITLVAAATGVTLANTGAGASQNMPPAAIVNWIIYAGA